jgi:hypothetical protein
VFGASDPRPFELGFGLREVELGPQSCFHVNRRGTARDRDEERRVRVDARLRKCDPLRAQCILVCRQRLRLFLLVRVEELPFRFDDGAVEALDSLSRHRQDATGDLGNGGACLVDARDERVDVGRVVIPDGFRLGLRPQFFEGRCQRERLGRRHERQRPEHDERLVELSRHLVIAGLFNRRRWTLVDLGHECLHALTGALERGINAMPIEAPSRVRGLDLDTTRSTEFFPNVHHGVGIDDNRFARCEQRRGQALERDEATGDVERSIDVVNAGTDHRARDATGDRGAVSGVGQHTCERAAEVELADGRMQREET